MLEHPGDKLLEKLLNAVWDSLNGDQADQMVLVSTVKEVVDYLDDVRTSTG